MAEPFRNKIILQVLNYWRDVWALGSLSGIAHWDLETYMPEKGAKVRGEMLARATAIRQKIFLNKDFVSLIHKAEKESGLTDPEKGVIRMLIRDLKFYEKLPSDFLQEFERLTNTGTVVWREAKEKNKYKLFEPYLKKIFEMNRKAADYLGYRESPYDALLDQFEEGLTSGEVQDFFDQIRSPLKDLVQRILKSNKPKNSYLETAKYDKAKMVAINEKVLKLFSPEFGTRLRLDISSHPFTTSFANTDTRITTWYQPKSWGESLLATVHEFGHALYDLQSADLLQMTPIAGGSSLVIHESQSRFWENFVGRSEEFSQYILSDVQDLLGNKKIAWQEIYSYFNEVTPSLNRVEADEITYHFHIMLRFEIEKGLIEGSVKFKDLREVWNAKMKEYLGIVPKRDSDGSLQDVHWSSGMVGYFPTYSLGTFLGAQWEQQIQKSKLKNQNFNSKVKNYGQWLGEHIHRYGSTYTLSDLLQKNGMTFDPYVNINYLKKKYTILYL